MVSKKKVAREEAIVRKPAKCPYCKKDIENIEYRGFGDGGYYTLVCHNECMFVLGVK